MADFDFNTYNPNNPSDFQWALRGAQKAYGWTDDDLAAILDVSVAAVQRWKSVDPPDIAWFRRRIFETLRTHVSSMVDT